MEDKETETEEEIKKEIADTRITGCDSCGLPNFPHYIDEEKYNAMKQSINKIMDLALDATIPDGICPGCSQSGNAVVVFEKERYGKMASLYEIQSWKISREIIALIRKLSEIEQQ